MTVPMTAARGSPVTAPRPTLILRVVAALLLAGYGLFLGLRFTPVAGGSDSSGYLNSARLLSHGRLTETVRPIPELHAADRGSLLPLGFVRDPDRDSPRLLPSYPVGLPLQQAVAARLLGWTAGPTLVGVGLALAAALLLGLCALELGLSPHSAIAAGAALVLSPVFVFVGIQPLSDVPATAWVLASAWLALRAGRPGRPAGWGAAAGFAFGMAVLVRPTNLLLLPVVALLVGRPRGLLAAAAGGLPLAAGLALYQKILYHDPLRTGYGGVLDYFSRDDVVPSLRMYAAWIPRLLPLAVGLPLLALCPGWRRDPLRRAALVLWALGLPLFYAFYDVTQEVWWCLRFILPAFPALILGSLAGIEAVVRWSAARWLPGSRVLRPAAAAACAVLVAWMTYDSWSRGREMSVLSPYRHEGAYRESCLWANAHIPAGSVVASFVPSGAVVFYTSFPVLRWDAVTRDEFDAAAAALARRGHPVHAIIQHFEEADAFAHHLGGHWTRLMESDNCAVWRWDGPSPAPSSVLPGV